MATDSRGKGPTRRPPRRRVADRKTAHGAEPGESTKRDEPRFPGNEAEPEIEESGAVSALDSALIEALERELAEGREAQAVVEATDAITAGQEEEEEAAPEEEAPVPTGPVFEGEVPLDTPEQRRFAMQKAAERLGIQELYPEQVEVIDAILRGEDVLMVLPTGFGKSACYQIPSMILPKPVLVISPLLALMKDQYEKLLRRNVPCVKLDGTVRGRARQEALERIAGGERVLVMTTPETLAASDAEQALARSGISLAAVDEAHCISEWGYDFRPAYLQIGERLRAMGAPPVLALTATATEKVRLAIQRFVGMREPRIVASSPHRSNLAFDVVQCSGGARLRALVRLALRVRRPGIIYCSTTRDVDQIYAILQRFGVPSYRYHGKMSGSERARNQEAFMQRGRRTVMVATSAFGLGIDKADIRYVMHYQSPASLEQYVQEAGRAGRDGRRANCILLYSPEDRAIHEALLSRSRVRPEQLYKLGAALAAWAQEDKVPSLAALALSAELGTRTTGALLALLEEATLVRWDQNAVYVTVPPEEIEPRSRELAGQFETLRTQDARRLDAMADYALDAPCRAVFLQEYFGEGESEPCGMCDRCRGQADRPNSFWEPLAPPKGEERGRSGRRGARSGRSRRGARGERRDREARGHRGGRSARRGRGGRRRGRAGPAEAEDARRAGSGSPSVGAGGSGAPRAESSGNGPALGADGEARRGRRRGRRRGGRGRRGRRGRGPRPGSGGPEAPTPPQS